jgi:indoleamine 2,3-dioxygenase
MWRLAKKLNKPPILSYDGYVLNNWKRKDPNGPIRVDNLELVQTFIEDTDQAWFILIHVDIEYKAATAIRNLWEAILAVERLDEDALERALLGIDKALGDMIATMKRMPEGASPDRYYRIRPWIMSFENVIYEGVREYGSRPQSWRGQTGAQTSIFQSLEAGLQMPPMEINELAKYLKEMRLYMPYSHSQFIGEVEVRSRVREFIVNKAPHLADAYNCCVEKICDFLDIHFRYAVTYIFQKTTNPKGTGGSNFMEYLKSRLDERRAKAYLRV